jgi:DNA repair exonuclease SbcCD ATPase subunit
MTLKYFFAAVFILCLACAGFSHAQESYKDLFKSCDENQKKNIGLMEKKEEELSRLKADHAAKIKALSAEINELRSKLATFKAMIEEYSSPTRKEKQIERLNAELSGKNSEMENLKNKISNAEAGAIRLAKELKSKDGQINSLQNALAQKDSKLRQLKIHMDSAGRALAECLEKSASKQETAPQVGQTDKDSEIKKLRKELEDKIAENKILTILVAEKGAPSEKSGDKEGEISELKKELEEAEKEIEKIEEANAKYSAEIERLNVILKIQQEEIEKLKQKQGGKRRK